MFRRKNAASIFVENVLPDYTAPHLHVKLFELILWCILYRETSCISIHYMAISAKTSFYMCLSSNNSIIPYLGHLDDTIGERNFRRCWHKTRMERGNPETRVNLELNRKYDDG
jgi:hypothetical protein